MALRIGSFVELGTKRGDPIAVAGRQLVPIARVLAVSLGRHGTPLGGLVWVRPTAVEVVEAGSSRRMAIPSANRRLLLGLAASMSLLWLLAPRPRLRRRRRAEEEPR